MSLGFLGEFQHSLDTKGRVILPVEFRERLAGGAVLTRMLDGCLAVYTADEFSVLAEQVRQSARQGPRQREVARLWFSSARELVPDKQGRVPIPQNLRDYAELERDVMVLGTDNRIELWNPAKWRDREAQAQEDIRSGEGLADIGFF
jgi:MraZ protein